MKYLMALLTVFSFLACTNTKNVPEENTTNQTTTPKDSISHFNVSFISIGAGTDTKAKEQFDQFIAAFEKNNAVKLNYEITNWGKEGEIDYCFRLGTLDTKMQEQFKGGTKEVLKNSSLVRYDENAICPNSK